MNKRLGLPMIADRSVCPSSCRRIASCIAVLSCAWILCNDSISLAQSQATNAPAVHVADETSVVSDTPAIAPASFSAADIGRIAYCQSSLANAIERELSVSTIPQHMSERQKANRSIRVQFMRAIARRHRQVAASQALKLHYGIAALVEGLKRLDELDTTLQEQIAAQNELIHAGIPIPDPLQFERLRTTVFDEALEKRSKLFSLRSQLAVLVGTSIACDYTPAEPITLVPRDEDVCAWIAMADRCRPDVATLRSLRNTITADTLDTWEQIASIILMTPEQLPIKVALFQPIVALLHAGDKEMDVTRRKAWVDALVAERSAQVHSEVEIAFDQKRTAAFRWVQSNSIVAQWETRIAQLKKLAEQRGNFAEQAEATLSLHRSRGPTIERWLDWQIAHIELRLAAGDDFQQ